MWICTLTAARKFKILSFFHYGRTFPSYSNTSAQTNQRRLFQIIAGSFLKDLSNYELRQVLELFEIGIGNYLSFRKGMFKDFDIQLRVAYIAEIEKFQKGINRVDLLLTHDRGLFGIDYRQHMTPRPKANGLLLNEKESSNNGLFTRNCNLL